MDKTKWPQSWKDQYNQELRNRQIQLRIGKSKLAFQDAENFPQIWSLQISEENIFPLIAYGFPLHRILAHLLQRFIKPFGHDELNLSTRYLNQTQNICPAYYSDRERAIVILNKFRNNEEWEKLFHWLSFFPEEGYHPHMHLMLGIIFLDKFISKTDQVIWLKESIHHLKAAENWVESENTKKALSAIQALACYLDKDFDKAMGYLGVRKKKTFEEEFAELMDKLAA